MKIEEVAVVYPLTTAGCGMSTYTLVREIIFQVQHLRKGVTQCQVHNKGALAFAFNALFFRQRFKDLYPAERIHLLAGATKSLLHTIAMVDQIIAMPANQANLRFNNTNELIYG